MPLRRCGLTVCGRWIEVFIPKMPSSRLMREYRRKERLELKLAVCKERIRVMEERDRPKYPPMPKLKKRSGEEESGD